MHTRRNIHKIGHTILFVFSVSQHPPTSVWLSTAGGKKWLITMATVCAVLLQL